MRTWSGCAGYVDVEAPVVVEARNVLSMTVRQPERRACRVRCSMSAILVTGFVDSRTRRAELGGTEDTLDARTILDRQKIVRYAVPREDMLHQVTGRPIDSMKARMWSPCLQSASAAAAMVATPEPTSKQSSCLQLREGQLELS